MDNNANFETAGTFAQDNLLAGDFPRHHKKVTLASGQNCLRGALLGAVLLGTLTATGAAGVPAPAAATITASPTAATGTAVGVHRFVCIVGGSTTASKWNHYGPDGIYIGTATGNTVYSGGGLSALTITDAGTDPVVGETFTVTVSIAAGATQHKLSLAAATDGSQVPEVVLAEDCDASAGAKEAMAYTTGDYNQDAITYGTGHTAASVKAGLHDRSIFLHNPINA